jgi:peroxiredoxin Q/BCP
VGISKDSVASHDRFKTKYKLKLTLASDPETEVALAYGVWVEKSMYGRKYMGVERATFLIDAKGVIREIWRKVKVSGHVEAVLAAAKSL